MKLRYLVPIVVAVIALFVGCTSDDDPIYLGSIRMSTSYVTLDKEGTPVNISFTANSDWSIDETTVPDWLKITPMSGSAGEQTITFTPEAGNSRTALVEINCGGQTQQLMVEQELVDPDPITVKEALNIIKSGNIPSSAVKVTGIVCKIQEISTQYKNATYYISDDGSYGADNWLEIYRGKWLDGADFTDENAFSVGDELTIKGVLMLYNNSVPETVQGTAFVVACNKSLIKVDSLDVTELPLEGGIVNAVLTCKGNGISVEIPAEAQSWLSIIGIDTQNSTVSFKALPNDGGARNTSVTFKTSDGGKVYTATAVISQQGTISEVTVGDFLAAEVGDAQYRLTGIVSNLYYYKENVSGFYIKDHTGEVLVYQPNGFTGTEAKVGDVVTVSGKRGVYKETPQLVSGALEAVKYAVTEISIADFVNVEDSNEKYYLLSGTIRQTSEDEKALGAKDDVTQYGNFYLVDAAGNAVYVYGVTKGWGGAKGQFGELGLTYGDKLTIVAYKSTYKGLIEAVGMYLSSEKAAQ